MNKAKKIACMLMSFVILVSTVFVTAAETKVDAVRYAYIRATQNVNIRKEPTTSSDVVGTAIKGNYVIVHSTVNGKNDSYKWHNITYNGTRGYIREDLLTLQPEYTFNTAFEQSITGFPESYKPSLRGLHTLYPNWKFIADKIPKYTFNELVAYEIPRKLVSPSSSLSWRSMIIGAYDWNKNSWELKTSNYYVASREVIEYYMDPRNFLTETQIFAFMRQDYDENSQTEEGVKSIIAGTFMENNYEYVKTDPVDSLYGGSYAKVIMAAAKQHKVSPYALAARIIQEQGNDGKSDLISGKYSGFVGYYNFFNVNATGSSSDAIVVKNGLTHAKNKGWDSRADAIIGGADVCKNGYIEDGQNTYFYMDYNIKNPDKIWHQYAEAVYDHINSGSIASKGYKSNKNSSVDFLIPVYDGMKETPTQLPEKSDKLNNYYFTDISVSGLTSSFEMNKYSYDLKVAANTTVKVKLPTNASYAGESHYVLKPGINTVTLKVKSQTEYINNYVISVNATKDAILYIDYGKGITPVNPDSGTTSKPDGGTSKPDTGKEIMMGDTNGDAKINGRDAANIQMHILGIKLLTGDAFKSADTNNDGKINGRDAANVQMHILGIKNLV